ncbi:hypothetical protein INR49_024635 [Caranx melampygus]|nr:hypothetical protein INR49_024635 [Caranx melampygus]
MVKLDGMSPKALKIDGTLPDEIIPDSTSNIFVSVEENGFGSQAVNLLSPERVAGLIQLPTGCCEQTMSGLAPTAAALRYFDLSEQWFNLPPGARDDALDKIEKGYIRVLIYKKSDGSYKPWNSVKSSTWLTAFVLKVFSLVAQHQPAQTSAEDIRHTASYLLSVQNIDGSFSDPHPVLHRYVLKGKDREASMTAFVTLALQKSLQFLQNETQDDVRARISNSTMYLMSNLEELRHPYAVAITAYCLSVCLPEGADPSAVRTRLQAMATERKDGCYLWTTDTSMKNQDRADAITVETTAYALLTAVTLNHTQWADKAACWLISQENYFGTFRSTQDTVMALEALAEYDLKRSNSPTANLIAVFRVSGRNDIATLALANREKVEIDLKVLEDISIVHLDTCRYLTSLLLRLTMYWILKTDVLICPSVSQWREK